MRTRLVVAVALAAASSVATADARPRRHFYVVGEPASVEGLRRHRAGVDIASPAWFEVDATGALVSRLDPALAAWARATRLPLAPLLVNRGFDPKIAKLVVTTPGIRQRLGDELSRLGKAHRLHGVHLDFEEVPAEDRAAFTTFVEELAARLKKDKLKLSVAVPAPLTPDGPGAWVPNPRAAGFDLAAIGRVAEFVTLMTYDQHTAPGEPGPVAGWPWTEACLRHALKLVPARRLMLGLPLYHRRWVGKATVADGPWPELAAAVGARPSRSEVDAVQRERRVEWTQDEGPSVGWGHDAGTLRERVGHVARLRLAGFSAWRIGQEDPEAWRHALSGRR